MEALSPHWSSSSSLVLESGPGGVRLGLARAVHYWPEELLGAGTHTRARVSNSSGERERERVSQCSSQSTIPSYTLQYLSRL